MPDLDDRGDVVAHPGDLDARLGWYIVIGTVPIVIFGVLFERQIETGARSLYLMGTTLIVSVTGDPVTPHQGGITMARTLGASLLTVGGAQHGIALIGQSECVDRTVADYLIDLQTPPDDARCTA